MLLCREQHRYRKKISLTSIGEINWIVVGGVIFGQFLFALMCVLKPVKFWVKFGAIFGLLFPSLTFRLVFLCPMGTMRSAIVAPPQAMHTGWALLYAFSIVVFGMAVGMKLQKKLLFWVFAIYWIFYLSAILFWRLYVQNLLYQ